MAVLAAVGWLDELWPRVVESLSLRWHQAVADPLGALFWTLIWGCAFVATFLFIRMLFTGWGDRNVTEKTLALSLLVHLVVAMLSTTVMLVRQPDPPSETRTPLRRVVVPNTGSADRGGGSTAGRPRWDTNAPPPMIEVERLDKPLVAGEQAPGRERTVSQPLNTLPLSPSLMAEESLSLEPQAQRAPAMPVRGREIDAEIDQESTASSRREALASPRRPGTAAMTATQTDDVPRRERTRSATGDSLSTDPGRSIVGRDVPEVAPSPRPDSSTDSGEGGNPVPDNMPAPATLTEASRGVAGRSAGSGRFGRTGAKKGTQTPRELSVESSPLRAPRREAAPLVTGITGGASREAGLGEPSEPTPALASPSSTRRGQGSELPPLYRLRDSASRDEQASLQGATAATERAVAAGLAWLSRVQSEDGAWPALESVLGEDPDKPRFTTTGNAAEESRLQAERSQSGLNAESGLTGLALLAYLGAGRTPDDPEYGTRVALGLQWLIRQQVRREGGRAADRMDDGYLGGRANRFGRMYCHGMAALALGEAYGMTGDPALKEPLERASAYIVRMQYPDGSWRYSDWRGQEGATGDMSLFGWQVMALKSAQTAGIVLPGQAIEQSLDRARTFLIDRQVEIRQRGESRHGGLASYRTGAGERVKPAMTAEALFCRQLLELPANPAATTEAVNYLAQRPPRLSQPDLYYWYYATLALFQEGGASWDKWNAALQAALIDEQRTQGDLAGSWNPRRPWGDFGGRVYSTAMSTLCLEVYYRYLPLTRSGTVVPPESQRPASSLPNVTPGPRRPEDRAPGPQDAAPKSESTESVRPE